MLDLFLHKLCRCLTKARGENVGSSENHPRFAHRRAAASTGRNLRTMKWIFDHHWQFGDQSVPGAFKLDHLQTFKPILLREFSISLTFILGGQFLLPQRANSEKREKVQFQKWMRQRSLSAWGIQTGPLAAL